MLRRKKCLQSCQKGQKRHKFLFNTMVTRYVSCTSCFQKAHSQLNFENITKRKQESVLISIIYLINSGVRIISRQYLDPPSLSYNVKFKEVCRGEAHVFQAARVLQHSSVNQVFPAKAYLDTFISQKSNFLSPLHHY